MSWTCKKISDLKKITFIHFPIFSKFMWEKKCMYYPVGYLVSGFCYPAIGKITSLSGTARLQRRGGRAIDTPFLFLKF